MSNYLERLLEPDLVTWALTMVGVGVTAWCVNWWLHRKADDE